MTSIRQIEANQRNAEKSTGPRTDAGKQRSALNAIRHGLTAETVVLPLEDPEDYQAFEETVLSSFEPETAVERELALRVAALLWRLRRADSIETGLFQLAYDKAPTASSRNISIPQTNSCFFTRSESHANSKTTTLSRPKDAQSAIADRFLNLIEFDGALERMTRYETSLWRQLRQTLFVIDVLCCRRALRQNHHRSRWSDIFPNDEGDLDR
jgi:hypothetical protein